MKLNVRRTYTIALGRLPYLQTSNLVRYRCKHLSVLIYSKILLYSNLSKYHNVKDRICFTFSTWNILYEVARLMVYLLWNVIVYVFDLSFFKIKAENFPYYTTMQIKTNMHFV